MAKLYLGVAHSRQGDNQTAEEHLVDAQSSLRDLDLEDQRIDAQSHLFWHQVQTGTADRAELEDFTSEIGSDDSPGGRALRALVCLDAINGDWPEARGKLVDALPSLSGYARALTLRMLSHFDDDDSDWGDEAQQIFDGLGVVKLRPLPDLAV